MFFFKEDYVGVFNPSQSIIKTVRLSQHSVSQKEVGNYSINLAGASFSIDVAYIPNQNALRVICDRTSGFMTASGNGFKTAYVQLPSEYKPKTNMYFNGLADFSLQFNMQVELKTDGKLYLTVLYWNGMNAFGSNKFGGMLYL